MSKYTINFDINDHMTDLINAIATDRIKCLVDDNKGIIGYTLPDYED